MESEVDPKRWTTSQSLLRLITALLVETSDEWETGTLYLNMQSTTQPSV